MGQFETRVDPVTGRTIKSGVNPKLVDRPRTPSHAYPVRAVVLNTYATDSSVRTQNAPSTSRTYEVECDIILVKSAVSYLRVPVQQKNHGLNDADLWIPRPSTRDTEGGEMNLTRVSRRGAVQSIPPNLETLNGDHVLVQFIEGDPEMPIITGPLSHSKTKRLVVGGSGWAEDDQGATRGIPYLNERYMRYRGTEVRINDAGDVLIDTVGANEEEATGTPGATGGQIRLRVKSTERFTVQMGLFDVLEVWQDPITQQVHIDLGEGADEQIVRGNKLTSWLLAHIHPNAMGGSGPPIDPAGTPPVSLTAGEHLSDDHKVK